LIEVLLVLAILVILGGMVGVYFTRIQGNAYIDATKTQISMFEQQLKLYRLDVGTYPSTDQGLNSLFEAPAGINRWRGPYSEKAIPVDPWGNPYQYESQGENLRIWSFGPDLTNGSDDDVSST
jgi:general secretion pathway protein G